jgi:molybdopterin-guanine dinucleotide biosynthesis protein A
MTGIVLAGGENRRMGADKAFLRIGGAPLIERVLRSLAAVCEDIIIVTNAPRLYDAYRARVATDALDARGPLTGMYTGLLHSTAEYNFVVACDMPFLNPRLMSYMAGLAGGHDIVVPRPAGVEPLHAIYRKSLLPVIEDRIRGNDAKIQGFFNEARVRYVTNEEIIRYDPEMRSFINLNTPEEYREVSCLDLECRS